MKGDIRSTPLLIIASALFPEKGVLKCLVDIWMRRIWLHIVVLFNQGNLLLFVIVSEK